MPKVEFCPRKICLGPVNLTPAGKMHAHKLPNGVGFCAGSNKTIEEAASDDLAEEAKRESGPN